MLTLIRNVALFSRLSEEELELLFNIAEPVRIRKNEVIINENQPCDYLYIIIEGYVRVVCMKDGSEQLLTLLEKGDSLGEVSFIDCEMPSASAIAQEDCKVLAFSHKELYQFLIDNPQCAGKVYQSLAETLCRKVRKTTRSLTLAKDLLHCDS